ncbi:hypothetical protein EES44_07910 [Streptomyces sp. ADI96-15]|uniref:hypothetical protein n=1 Tax=Streptomyces sp. ADI96-15 TaxID=1522761 RepID=UPI000F5568CB|nr:hypothetical protein [Streptomyces sp. ADI96-15]RPK69046.1 hypothetical protein EES44_07910 [Streptomyces sp. ADI96-15]
MTNPHATATAGGSLISNEGTPGRPALTVHGLLIIDAANVRARYDCHLCRTTEGPVHGTDAVTAFAADIRTSHPTRCTARENRP